jgi:hypothetical protein
MKKQLKAKAKKHKLTDDERHARFVDTARKVGASDDPKDFEQAFKRVTTPSKKAAKSIS